jgi:hypothetical protein
MGKSERPLEVRRLCWQTPVLKVVEWKKKLIGTETDV